MALQRGSRARTRASPLALALAATLFACGEAVPPVAAAAPGDEVALADGVRRLDLRFPCGDTDCAGWLFLPASAEHAPVVVMAHGFAGTRDVGLPLFAERFARGLADVDGERVALFGSSLGAGHALITAAEDGNVRAVVAQAPLLDSSAEGESTFYGVGWLVRLLFTGWADLARSGLGGEPILIPSIAPSDGFGMIVDDGAFAAFEKLVAPGSTYRNAVVAHSVFTFDAYDPAPSAAEIRVPILLVASRASAARIETIEGDHFEIYAPPLAGRVADLEAAFLVEQLE